VVIASSPSQKAAFKKLTGKLERNLPSLFENCQTMFSNESTFIFYSTFSNFEVPFLGSPNRSLYFRIRGSLSLTSELIGPEKFPHKATCISVAFSRKSPKATGRQSVNAFSIYRQKCLSRARVSFARVQAHRATVIAMLLESLAPIEFQQ